MHGLDAADGALGLVFFVVALDHLDRLTFAQVAPQSLLIQLGVQRDHVVGRPQDGAGRAVVLFQRDHFELRIVLRQALEVVQRGAAPAVDGLVVVAHGGEDAAIAHQQLEHVVLGGVGVLVFIDQHMAQVALPLGAHVLVLGQQFHRQADQVIEVDRLVGHQALFVQAHDAGANAFVVVLGHAFCLGAAQALVLPAADGPLPAAGQGGVGGAARVADNAQHVIAVHDGELGFEAQRFAILAQQAHAQ